MAAHFHALPRLFLVIAFWLVLLTNLHAGDWPQILGPNRSGVAGPDEQLVDKFPAGGPLLVWEREVGSGYAGVAIVGNQGILFHRDGGREITESFDAATGERGWQVSHPTTFQPQVGGENGPLCVPTITGDKVITFGAQGVLSCIDRQSGKRLWMRDTHREFNAREGYFGAGSSPLVIGDRVIVNIGGTRDDAGIVAFSLATGETIWQQTEEPASYSAPIEVTVAGLPHVLMVTRYQCVLLEPERGAIRFRFPFGQRGPTVNGASPVVHNDRLLVTSAYGVGSVYATIDLLESRPIWKDERKLGTQYCTPIVIDDVIYAIDGRDDVPPADLKALRAEDAEMLWVEHNFGYGSMIQADGKLLLMGTDGELTLCRPDPKQFVKLDSARILRGTARALPALANGKLYVRDERTLKCVDLRR